MDDIAISLYHWVRTDKNPEAFGPITAGYFGGNRMTDQERIAVSFYLLLQGLRFVSFCERVNPLHKVDAYRNLDKIIQFIDSERLYKL